MSKSALADNSTIFESNNLTIRGNSAGSGGGIYAANNSTSSQFTGLVVNENSAVEGGGIYLTNAHIGVGGGEINNNVATEQDGGAIYLINDSHFYSMGNDDYQPLLISGNTSFGKGGGIYVDSSHVSLIKSGLIK